MSRSLNRRALLAGGGALFFRNLSDRLGATDDRALSGAIWDLVWSGHLTNDTVSPLRAVMAGTGGSLKS